MKCEYAYGRRRDLSMICKKMQDRGKPYPYCAYQYYCAAKGRWLVKEDAKRCPLRAKTQDRKD